VRLEIYNAFGRKVKTLYHQQLPAGHHEIEFDAVDLTSGVYFCSLQAGSFHAVRKMLLLR
jgi:hypothetical protein